MDSAALDSFLAALPKAELHLHLEGSIAPVTAVELAARNGVAVTSEEVTERYASHDFLGFLLAFKWVTSLLQTPEDYGFITARLVEELRRQNIVYAEVTISAGVMIRRQQDVEANFAAIREASEHARAQGLRMQWIFDAARQFGPAAAMEVAEFAARCRPGGVVAYGMGGDELSLPASEFRAAYAFARSHGLHLLAHAGEIGGPESIREAVEDLGAERIGHGIAALRDPELIDWLRARRIPLENCISSNVCTGALATQLKKDSADSSDHPLKSFFDRGLGVALSTDDPAMFHTDLLSEYRLAAALGLGPRDLLRLVRMSWEQAFLPAEERRTYVEELYAVAKAMGIG